MIGRCLVSFAVVVGVAVSAAEVAATKGDAGRGQTVFTQQCAVCHAVEQEYHKEGPSLHGVYGRRAGKAPFFPRYKALKNSPVVWDEQSLDAWLADPRGFVGGQDTGMTGRMADAQQRADVIAYLRTLR
jgi:cytochrome c